MGKITIRHAQARYLRESDWMKVVPISNRKFDAITEFMLREGIPITLRNYLDLTYWKRVRLADLDAEAIADIPDYLLPKKYRRESSSC